VQFESIQKITYLKTIPYRSNVGITRLFSHPIFSLSGGFYFLRRQKIFDVVYATMPFNALAWIAFRFAGNRLKIVDITDICPDVLPFSQAHKKWLKPLCKIWRYLFNDVAGRQAS